ncbi:centrosomal protein of 63 kDa isoform X2 [Xenopus tropicalis]|uniref:Centrosomal protein of 63 kDa isoform X2 n=1 Tax=Xenopus tropicalis TaxID=8364 RepID=A0A8J1JPF3_XENTR|nr:centrosomal protein of 63 kDa isoform X2 [Xenopus tropicalis]
MEALLQGIQQQERMGSLQGSCEAELQELMRQIDIMLDHKRSQWEAETETLKTRLELKEQELKSSLDREDHLNQEVRRLRQQLIQQEEETQNKTVQYEAQLSGFKEELNRLKKSYEKVQKKHLRSEMKNKVDEERSEVSRLTRRLEEFRQRSLDWEKQRLLYQQQLAGLEAQRKTLSEQAEMYQQHNRKQMLEQTSLAGCSELQNLSGQLLRANDSLCVKEEEVETLKMQLRSAVEGQKRAEQEMAHSRQIIQALKDEKAELKATLKAHTEFLQGSRTQKDEYLQEGSRGSEAQREKNSIRSLEEQLQENRLIGGQTEVEAVRSELSVSRMNEQRLQAEVTCLEDSVESVATQCQLLAKELKAKAEYLHEVEEEHKKCLAEMKKLKGQLSQTELTHKSVLDGMRKEISQLTQELHTRDIRMASNAGIDWERKIRAERERAEREAAENRTLNNLEQANQRLQKELLQTQEKLELIMQRRESEIQNAVDRSQELLKKQEQELTMMQERLKVYEQELQTFRSQQDAASSGGSLESIFSEVWKEQAMASPICATNVDSSAEPVEDLASSLPVPPTSPANAVASRFLQEEEQRSHELLQRLNAHIEELKQESQRTVEHFTQPR